MNKGLCGKLSLLTGKDSLTGQIRDTESEHFISRDQSPVRIKLSLQSYACSPDKKLQF